MTKWCGVAGVDYFPKTASWSCLFLFYHSNLPLTTQRVQTLCLFNNVKPDATSSLIQRARTEDSFHKASFQFHTVAIKKKSIQIKILILWLFLAAGTTVKILLSLLAIFALMALKQCGRNSSPLVDISVLYELIRRLENLLKIQKSEILLFLPALNSKAHYFCCHSGCEENSSTLLCGVTEHM